MSLYNPYRNFDKGMDDAYMGNEPNMSSRDYMEGYDYSCELMEEPKEEPLKNTNAVISIHNSGI